MDNSPVIKSAPANIVVVDDTPANLVLLSTMLNSRGYIVRPVPSGKQALKTIEAEPPDLILLDITMPDMDGFEVCAVLKADPRFASIPIIFISALYETLDKVKAFKAGGVDYISKPFQFQELEVRIQTHLNLRRLQLELRTHNEHLEDLVKEKVAEIANSQLTTIVALAKLAERRDDDTGAHIDRIGTFCRILAAQLQRSSPYAQQINNEFIDMIFYTAPLHDIGKVGINDKILLKPGKLTPEEFEEMKKHTILGAETLQSVRQRNPKNAMINMGIAIARSHHEKWDGSGYPDSLVGESIPLAARIMAVADVYDALRSRRPYKSPCSHAETLDLIREGIGSHFDPTVTEALLAIEAEFESIWSPDMMAES